MMASHGRGRRVGLAVLMAVAGLAGAGGLVQAGAISPGATTASSSASTATTPTPGFVDPTSLAPQVPPLTTGATPTPTAASATTSPAADGVVPTVAPPGVATFGAPSPTTMSPTCTCSCTSVPLNPPPIVSNPYPGTPSGLQPSTTPNAPEPTSIVSALAMVGAAVAWRRRARRAG